MFVLVLGFGSAAMGGVITFDNLTGANGDSFTTYSEGGFTVGAPAGEWSKEGFHVRQSAAGRIFQPPS
jgi:hypothetical protein